MEAEFSGHALDMLTERGIDKAAVLDTVRFPDATQHRQDGTTHYYKQTDGKTLHVVINSSTRKIITLFYDRRGIVEG